MNKILLCLFPALILTACNGGSTTNNYNTIADCQLPAFNSHVGADLLNAWGVGLQTYNAANNADVEVSAGYFTMSFYTPDAILLPTVSYIQRYGTQEVYDYFTHFLANNPVMTLPNTESNIFVPLGCGYGGADGYYNFTLNPDTPQESAVSARFTFIYKFESQSFTEQFTVADGPDAGRVITQTNLPGWYVLSQQSSALPINP